MNRILKWLLIIVLAEAAFLGVAIVTNVNRRERLRQFLSEKTPTYDVKGK